MAPKAKPARLVFVGGMALTTLGDGSAEPVSLSDLPASMFAFVLAFSVPRKFGRRL
jgi:hypothetical protein